MLESIDSKVGNSSTFGLPGEEDSSAMLGYLQLNREICRNVSIVVFRLDPCSGALGRGLSKVHKPSDLISVLVQCTRPTALRHMGHIFLQDIMAFIGYGKVQTSSGHGIQPSKWPYDLFIVVL